MTTVDITQGLTCPNCRGNMPVPEGVRIVQCPYCQMHSLVQGERGVRRWQVSAKISRVQASRAVKRFFSGLNKATDLKKEAEIREIFLVYLPYWHVTAFVAGWLFGRVKASHRNSRPVEIEVGEVMTWTDAATDVSEFGVHQVTVSKQDLEPFSPDVLSQEALIFEATESHTAALAQAEKHFIYLARKKQTMETRFFEKYHHLRTQLSLLYYPLWVARYQYRGRNYQVVVDGVQGTVLYGKAPGNIFFRAAALVIGMALGNLMLIDGTLLMATYLTDTLNSAFFLLILPIITGFTFIIGAYQAFRYGEEIEMLQESAKKAAQAEIEQDSDTPPSEENTFQTALLVTE